MKTILDYNPPLLSQRGHDYVIRFNVAEVSTEDGIRYECDEVLCGDSHYGSVVSALIHAKYSVDAELAIINNHLTNDEQTEWNEYQSHRAWAKNYATETLEIPNEETY